MRKQVVTIYRCEGCGHEWQPRRGQAPKVCPKCKRFEWNRKRPNTKTRRVGARTPTRR